MVRHSEPEAAEEDERLGEAIEAYLALVEAGPPPEPEAFAAGYPGLEADLIAALEGLALVQGLVGDPGGPGPGSRLEKGRRIAGYRIVRELGRGGMGVVYEAVHVGLDRPVALKVLGGHAAPDSDGRRRFLNEARTAAGLHHTHIVPVFDVGQVGGLCYYAMQRIEGSGLDRVVRHLRRDRTTGAGSASGGPTPLRSRLGLLRTPSPRSSGRDEPTGTWPPDGDLSGGAGDRSLTGGGLAGGRGDGGGGAGGGDEPPPFVPPRGSGYFRWVAEVGREAAEALGFAHHRGVIHRDVKPSNLLVDGRGLIWVADFGLARRLADPSLTQHDSLLGTPRYMSPEQARVGPIDGRSDLYSLGATLYELLTLRPPFEGRTAAELVDQIAHDEPTSPRVFDPGMPRDLETIVLKLLAKRPADRYASSADLAEDLTRFLNYEPVVARRISPFGRAWRFARRHPGITAVSAAAAATVLAVTTVAYVKILHERDRLVVEQGRTIEAMRKLEQTSDEVVRRSEMLAVEQGKTLEAMRNQQLATAQVVRRSNMPDRRAEGLGLIRAAAALKPGPAVRTRLRDEAIEFLVMRDVEARPGFPTGRARGLAFGPDGAQLVTLSPPSGDGDDGLGVWDVARRERLSGRPTPAPVPAAAGSPPSTPPPSGRGNRSRGPNWPLLAAAGPNVAASVVEGQGRDALQTVRLVDAATAEPVTTMPMPGRRVRGLFATPDGGRLVTIEQVSITPTPGPGPGADPSAGRGGPGGPPPSKPSPGRRPTGYVVNLWDPERPQAPAQTLTRTDPDDPSPGFPMVAVGPDGKFIATAWFHKTAVSLWSAATGEPQTPGFIDTQTELTALAFGPDNQLATAGGGEVRLWDAETRTPLPSLTPNQSEVRLLRFSPRGPLLAVVGLLGRDVELWDTSAHAVVAVLPTPDPVEDLAFSPDGRTLAAATQGAQTLAWAVVEPDVRVRIAGFDVPTRTLAFRDDGLLAMGVWKGAVRFWDEGHRVQTGSSGGAHHAAASADPARDREPADPSPPGRERPASMAFTEGGALVTLETEGLRVWSGPPRCPKESVLVRPAQDRRGFFSGFLAPSHDGRTLAVFRDGSVSLWRPAHPDEAVALRLPAEFTGRGRERGPGPGRPGGGPLFWRAAAVSPDGGRLYLVEFGSPDGGGKAHAWAIDGGNVRALAWPDLPSEATSLALSADGGVLAVGDRSGGVSLFDTGTGAAGARLARPAGAGEFQTLTLAFSPDAKELAVGTQQGTIFLWSLADHDAPILRLPGHRGSVYSLTYDAPGLHLASSGGDKTVDVWDFRRIREEFARLGVAW